MVETLWLRPGARLPVRAVTRAFAVASVGLAGDHAQGGKRQVTLLSAERWSDACRALGVDVDAADRRANVLVTGIDLEPRRGEILRVGPVSLCIEGETRPCELLERAATAGLSRVLRDHCRGGIYGRVVEGGEIAVGDPVTWDRGPLR